MDNCIEWTGFRRRDGYGQRRYEGVKMGAHRAAWIEAHGPIPDDLCVLHHCDNPPCVNVEHLFLGTRADNLRDMDAKGRRGARAPKLTAEQVVALRERYAAGGVTMRSLAAQFGISSPQVSRIVHHQSRGDV